MRVVCVCVCVKHYQRRERGESERGFLENQRPRKSSQNKDTLSHSFQLIRLSLTFFLIFFCVSSSPLKPNPYLSLTHTHTNTHTHTHTHFSPFRQSPTMTVLTVIRKNKKEKPIYTLVKKVRERERERKEVCVCVFVRLS